MAPWHQDQGVTREEADQSEILTTWTPLFDVGIAPGLAGPLQVMPNRIKNGLLPHIRADYGTTIDTPHLRFGEISPRSVYWAVKEKLLDRTITKTFLRRLYWRDLAYFHNISFPEMSDIGIRKHYDETKWTDTRRDSILRIDMSSPSLFKSATITLSLTFASALFLAAVMVVVVVVMVSKLLLLPSLRRLLNQSTNELFPQIYHINAKIYFSYQPF